MEEVRERCMYPLARGRFQGEPYHALVLWRRTQLPAFSRGQYITVCARVRTPTTPPPAMELDLAAVEFKYVWASP